MGDHLERRAHDAVGDERTHEPSTSRPAPAAAAPRAASSGTVRALLDPPVARAPVPLPATRIRRSSAPAQAPLAATSTNRAPRIQRSSATTDVIRRKIGPGQSHSVVENSARQRYLANESGPSMYSLQPLAGGTPIEVGADDDEYTVVPGVADTDVVAAVEPGTKPAAAHDVLEWMAGVHKALAADKFAEAESLLKRMKAVAGALAMPAKSVALNEKELTDKLSKLPHSGVLKGAYRTALLLPKEPAVALLLDSITKGHAAIKGVTWATTSADAVAKDCFDKLRELRRTPDMAPTIVRLLTADVEAASLAEARSKATAHEAAPLTLAGDAEFLGAFKAMAVDKLAHEVADGYAGAVALAAGSDDALAADMRVRAALIHHLRGPIKGGDVAAAEVLKKDTVDAILAKELKRKAERIQHLFFDRPKLMDNVVDLVQDGSVHASLAEMRGGKEHSIKNINDYVGDKLNDPLMKWVVEQNIKVEVHATTTTASFAKLKADGFTDIIQIPSSHEGTAKYVVTNPESKASKVVFQTRAGASYAISTIGAFLFYELYAAGALKATELGGDGPWRYGTYTARNVIANNKQTKVATYLLQKHKDNVGDDPATFAADVPYISEPYPINSDGSIELKGVPGSAVTVKEMTVSRLAMDKLKVFKEDVDYEKMYLDIFRKHGVDTADVAIIGRKKEVKAMLAKDFTAKKAALEISVPGFNAELYGLSGSFGSKRVLLHQISPDFFGDRAGYLAKALEALGVGHIAFVGTAGGTGPGIKKFDTAVPEMITNIADHPSGTDAAFEPDNQKKNSAKQIVDDLAGTSAEVAAVKAGGLHVGVHSPISESQELIDWMRSKTIASMDCEGGFIGDVLKKSSVSLYAIYFISDIPGTHESIGQGGIAGGKDSSSGGSATPTRAASEQVIREMIKRVVGDRIAVANDRVPAPLSKIITNGKIEVQVANGRGSFDLKHIEVTVAEPKVLKRDSTIGVLNMFAQKAATILTGKPPELTPSKLSDLNDAAYEFGKLHGVRVDLTVK